MGCTCYNLFARSRFSRYQNARIALRDFWKLFNLTDKGGILADYFQQPQLLSGLFYELLTRFALLCHAANPEQHVFAVQRSEDEIVDSQVEELQQSFRFDIFCADKSWSVEFVQSEQTRCGPSVFLREAYDYHVKVLPGKFMAKLFCGIDPPVQL
jgi:hypothetical protein